MAEVLKNLGQSLPNANTLTAVYTVPVGKSAVVSSIVVCNQSGAPVYFRISHALAGAADDPAQYLYHGQIIPAHGTFIATIGITMAANDVLRVLAEHSDVSFNVYGAES